jgi:ribosomal protein S10
MSNYTLSLYSKNKNSLNHFINFLKNNNKQNLIAVTKYLKKIKIKKKLSVLKSPHVNKTAQEQFQYIYICNSLTFYTNELKKSLFYIKKIKNQLFPDIKIIIKGIYKNKNKKEKQLYDNRMKFYSQKFKIKNQKYLTSIKKKNLLTKTILYLKYLDYYGKK